MRYSGGIKTSCTFPPLTKLSNCIATRPTAPAQITFHFNVFAFESLNIIAQDLKVINKAWINNINPVPLQFEHVATVFPLLESKLFSCRDQILVPKACWPIQSTQTLFRFQLAQNSCDIQVSIDITIHRSSRNLCMAIPFQSMVMNYPMIRSNVSNGTTDVNILSFSISLFWSIFLRPYRVNSQPHGHVCQIYPSITFYTVSHVLGPFWLVTTFCCYLFCPIIFYRALKVPS